MIELGKERVAQILHEETLKTEDLKTLLRSIYTRYLRLFEKYFANLESLNNDKIAEMRQYHEETRSLVRYYYMDIPQDVCTSLTEFEDVIFSKVLGTEWRRYLLECIEEFKDESETEFRSEEQMKAEFRKQNMKAFYEAMGKILRPGFDTESKMVEKAISSYAGIAGLLFGKSSSK